MELCIRHAMSTQNFIGKSFAQCSGREGSPHSAVTFLPKAQCDNPSPSRYTSVIPRPDGPEVPGTMDMRPISLLSRVRWIWEQHSQKPSSPSAPLPTDMVICDEKHVLRSLSIFSQSLGAGSPVHLNRLYLEGAHSVLFYKFGGISLG